MDRLSKEKLLLDIKETKYRIFAMQWGAVFFAWTGINVIIDYIRVIWT